MKAKNPSKIVENFQLTLFTVSYVLSLFLLVFLFDQLDLQLNVLVNYGIFLIYILGSVALWAYLHVFFSIPKKMLKEFDFIKNKISTKEVSNFKQFADVLFVFVEKVFNYSFLDVDFSALKISSQEVLLSSEDISETADWDSIEQAARLNESIILKGKTQIGTDNFYHYIIPIYFNEKYLGFFSVFTRQKLGPFRLKFFVDLEDYFIDDQLIHLFP